MKTLLIYTFISLLTAPIMLIAQTKSEFALELSSDVIEIKPGETKTIDVKVVRTKGYEKYKAKMGFSSATPQGLTLNYETSQGVITATRLTITATESAKEDSYMLLPNCVLNNKTKSAVLKVVLKSNDSISRGE
jgi:hypothetical protein